MTSTRRFPFVLPRTTRDGRIRWRGFADVDGQRVYSKTFDTQEKAWEAAKAMRGEARNTADALTLEDACEALLDELRLKRTRGTVRWYADHLRTVKELLDSDTFLHSITPERLEQFVRDRLAGGTRGRRKTSAATVNADLRALHRVFAVAIRRGQVTTNPVRLVDRPRADAPAMDWFTDAELRAVLAKVTDEHARDVLLLFALTGVRRAEAARLEPGHVRSKLGQLVVPGKNATRVVPLSPDLDAPLRRLLARAGSHLLPGGTHAIDDVFRLARKACGDRRLHPHALRHTFGTALIRKGVRPDVVMHLMGHRSLTTTLRYVHQVGDDGVKAVRLLQLVPPPGSGRAGQA